MAGGTRSGRAIGALAVVVVAAVAGLSLASSLTGSGGSGAGDPDEPTTAAAPTTVDTTPPDLSDRGSLPAPEGGRYEGRLAYVDRDCRLQVISLLTVQAQTYAEDLAGCSIGLSERGDYGVEFRGAGRPVGVVALTSGHAENVGTGPALGPPGYGDPAVSDDGTVAVCSTSPATGDARVVATPLGGGEPIEVDGCRPAFSGTALLVAGRGRPAAVRNALGETVVPRSALPRASRGDLIIATSADAGLVGILSRTESFDRVDLSLFDTGGTPRGAWQEIHSGADLRALRVASGGKAVAVDVNGLWRLVSLRGERAVTVETVAGARIDDVDFSPDGRTAAVVIDDAILLVDAGTLGPLASIPADATSVRWLP